MADYYNLRSKYQKIVVSSDPLHYGEHILYLDGMWQYNSAIEFKYHEVIATMSCCVSQELNRVLICGGGDGLAAREILRFPNVEYDMAEIDDEVIRLYQNEKMLTCLNQNSMNSDRGRVNAEDAVSFAERQTPESYDVLVIDFPSPGDGNRDKNYPNLFSPEITNKFLRLLKPHGVVCSQTSIPPSFLIPHVRNLLGKGFFVWNLDNYYDAGSAHDNFTFACRYVPKQERDIPQGTRYLTRDHIRYGLSRLTEVDYEYLEFARLFEHTEDLEVEYARPS